MCEITKNSKFILAKKEADKVEDEIIQTLKSGCSFRVEAGAGSGKTYSLKQVIDWIQTNKLTEYQQNKQKVVCITYTNAAVDVIAERLSKDSFILPSTIHSFAWRSICQYQDFLIDVVTKDQTFHPKEGADSEVNKVDYSLGKRYREKGIHYLYHDDVLKLFCLLLKNEKFRRIFTNKYPLILIDEYQDSDAHIIDCFVKFFISKREGPQFAFFGDEWQTIYQDKGCGLIEHENIKVIKKVANFRSAPKIVKLLNSIRQDLPQKSAIDDFDGEVFVITCDDYIGARRNERTFMGDLPQEELKTRLKTIEQLIRQKVPENETTKVLMITHKVLAQHQGYDELLTALGDGFKNKEDPLLLFFMETVEPVYKALDTLDMQLLFETLKVKRVPITKKSDKQKWKELYESLKLARNQKVSDVLNLIEQTGLVPLTPKIELYIRKFSECPDDKYNSKISYNELLNMNYSQFIAAINFLYPDTTFSTEHGVKGEEYDNVVFVISKGWPLYSFDQYAPMMLEPHLVPKDKESSYKRNRNLFYVCCSRPKKRLYFFISIELPSSFRKFLEKIVGIDNIFTCKEFIEKYSTPTN